MSLESRARTAAEGLRAATAVETEVRLAQLRRTHRRRSATRVAAAAVGIAATIMAGAALLGDRDTAEPAPAGPQIVEIPATRSQQVVVEPEITSDVTPGEQLVDSTSTGDPAYDGDGSIELSVGDSGRRLLRVEGSCADAPEASYVMLIEPETYSETGRCDGTADKVGGVFDYNEEYSGKTLVMFVTDQNWDPRAFHQCFENRTPEACDHLGLLRGTRATMSLAIYEWHPGPTAVHMFGQSLPARANAFDQTWSLTRAAAAATGARTLSFRVDKSSHDMIAQVVYLVRDNTCSSGPQPSPWLPPSQGDGCVPTVELSIDGEVVDDPPYGGPFFTPAHDDDPFVRRATWDKLATGQAHDVAIRLVGGDPTAVDVGVITYEAD